MADLCFVVPIYRVPYNYLHECIDSILKQSCDRIEVVLVDDGSPDECGSICDTYAQQDPRVKVVHKKNGGLSDARNAGIENATASWITFVDGDDWVDLDFTEEFLERAAARPSADMYFYSGYRNYAQKQLVCAPYYEDGRRFATYAEREVLQKECCLVPTRSNGEGLFIGSAWAKVYRLEFLKKNNLYFTIVPYGEDSIYYMYTVEAARCIEYADRAIYHYRDTEGSMVNKYRINADKEQDIYLDKIFKFADRYHKSADFIDTLYLRVFISLQRCISQKFYNDSNPQNIFERHRSCRRFLGTSPYCEIPKHVSFSTLNKKSKLKYALIWLRMYGAIDISRKLYLHMQGKHASDRR